MNPDWSKAPEWAFFHLTTKLGAKFWLEYPPKVCDDNPSGFEYRGGRVEFAAKVPGVGPVIVTRR